MYVCFMYYFFIASSKSMSEKDIFRKQTDILSNALANHSSFVQFIDTLVANDLISMVYKNDLITRLGFSDLDRASKLVGDLYINISESLSPDYFTHICEALDKQEDLILKGIGQTMMKR